MYIFSYPERVADISDTIQIYVFIWRYL